MSKFQGKTYDPENISGQTLAKIGKIILETPAFVRALEKGEKVQRTDYDSISYLKWLDTRIDEVCQRGRI